MSTTGERKFRDVRDIWSSGREPTKENHKLVYETTPDTKIKHKYKTLERHMSMKKTIRKKMMRDLREIGDATSQENESQAAAFLDQIKNDQPPSENIEKPSLWKRLTKGWGH